MNKKQRGIQYRYYEMPPNSPALPLLGSGWIREYGLGIEDLHFHNYLEIGYCYDGAGDLELGEDVRPFSGGMFSIIPPNFPHNTRCVPGTKSRWEYLFVDVYAVLCKAFPEEPDLVEQIALQAFGDAVFLRHSEDLALSSLILNTMDEFRNQKELHLESACGMLLALIIHISRLHAGKEKRYTFTAQRNAAIIGALDYVMKHYAEKIRICELAQACHISETHFRRLFQAVMHIPPNSYINLIRVEMACKLMCSTSEPLKEIAAKCGFTTLSSFNRHFREFIGVSPLQWRRDNEYFERRFKDQKILSYQGWR